jgi:hypothetical protein
MTTAELLKNYHGITAPVTLVNGVIFSYSAILYNTVNAEKWKNDASYVQIYFNLRTAFYTYCTVLPTPGKITWLDQPKNSAACKKFGPS